MQIQTVCPFWFGGTSCAQLCVGLLQMLYKPYVNVSESEW